MASHNWVPIRFIASGLCYTYMKVLLEAFVSSRYLECYVVNIS